MQNNFYKLKDVILSANTGLDAIQRVPIVNYITKYKCLRIQDISQSKKFTDWGNTDVQDVYYNDFRLKANDIILARTGSTIGINLFIKKDLPSVFNNGLIRLRTNHLVLPYYCYLFMQTNYFKEYINNISCGTSTQPNMKINDLLNIDFPYVELSIQQHIVNTIGSIDDLIESITNENSNLISLGISMYKHEYKNDFATTKNLIKFEKGIEVGSKEYLDISNNNNIEYYRVGDLNNMVSTTFVNKKFLDSANAKIGDVIITFDGCPGRVGFTVDGCFSGSLRKIIDINSNYNNGYLYFWAISDKTQYCINEHSFGTTILHASKAIDYLEIPIHPCEIILNNLNIIYQQMIQNVLKIKKLNKLKQLYLKKFFG